MIDKKDFDNIWGECCIAARRGDLNTIKDGIQKNGIKEEDYISLALAIMLGVAAENGHCEIVEYLLANGAGVNAKIDWNNSWIEAETPLTAAIHAAQVTTAKLLIEKGADLKAMTAVGLLPIHYGVSSHKDGDAELSVINLLLDKGVHIESQDWIGNTVLQTAAFYGRTNLVRELISKGARVNRTNVHNWTPLCSAISPHSLDTVKCLVSEGAEINYSGGCLALGMAARRGYLDIVTFLLDKKAKPFPRSDSDDGPELLHAARSGNSKIFKLLVDHGYGNQGPESLLTACQNDSVDVVSRLLDHGVSVNVRNAKQQTPLHIAVIGKDKSYFRNRVIRLLIEKGANVNAVDAEGKSALDLARELNCKDVIDILTASN